MKVPRQPCGNCGRPLLLRVEIVDVSGVIYRVHRTCAAELNAAAKAVWS
jgi:hypothetical protein